MRIIADAVKRFLIPGSTSFLLIVFGVGVVILNSGPFGMLLGRIWLTALLALGVGMWLSALNVKYRDVRYALPFLIQLWMFASPIIYPVSMMPEQWRWVLWLNPLSSIIEGYRAALLGRTAFPWLALALSALITFAVLLSSAYSFRRMERTFADVV